MNRMQLAGRRWKFKLGSLNELLVATVQKTRYLSTNQRSGMRRKDRWRILVCGRHQHRSGPVLAHQPAACDLG